MVTSGNKVLESGMIITTNSMVGVSKCKLGRQQMSTGEIKALENKQLRNLFGITRTS